ncbi:MAG: PQQ-dependent sugar dehydrogenase [Tunicatimonas sp.]|uniref:PQQ-dependent sugar dehydrogenase n=1 Tax=Tunicatimonas sp. TaxID=1940096 RepID=UPI003C749875
MMRIISWQMFKVGILSSFLVIVSCGNSDDSPDLATDTNDNSTQERFTVVEAYPNLSFTRPVDFQHAGDGSDRIFVVEQRGVITVFDDNAATSQSAPFLDISGPVDDRSNEEGLLGLAFDPNYASNGHFFVNYTISNPARTRISRFAVSASNPDQANPNSELVILEFEQPFGNHNGGQVAFGPDGYLYVAVGDGGSAGDPRRHGQNLTTLLGSILRIDVSQSSPQTPYAIPGDNPFAENDQGFREEIYAYGLRNPWRFSFDTETGQLWTGDVGQNQLEEVDLIENGGNYGWNTTEASQCFEPRNNCDKENIILPVWEYDHSQQDLSITGGHVYRGAALSELVGQYVYADFVSGRVWSLDANNAGNPQNTELIDSNLAISSFGLNAENELFLCAFDGKIYRIESVASSN